MLYMERIIYHNQVGYPKNAKLIDVIHTLKREKGWRRWLMPVIALQEAKTDPKIPRPVVQDQPGQYGETLSLLKLQKLARHGSRQL